MRAWYKSRFNHPVFFVGLAAFLTAFLVQSGELGSIDTVRRLQTTHSFWTSAPPVVPQDYPEFGIVGRGGLIYSWYGMGQSLLMLPSDIVGTYLAHLPRFARFAWHQPGIREFVVSYSTNILVCVLTALACLRFFRVLEFTPNQAIAGAFSLLFGTTFLHYTQNMTENNFIFLLTVTGLCFQYEWLRTGRTASLVIGSLALGAGLLTRLTTAMDIAAAALFVLLVLWWKQVRGRELLGQLRRYACVAGPCYATFLLVDRMYQYHRFGSFFNTYMTVFAEQQTRLTPSLPPNFPWTTPLKEGVLGSLFSLRKSIFLFDPLIVITLLLSVVIWKRFRSEIKAYLLAALWLLVIYILFYAKWLEWSGEFAWGDRYITTPVQLLAIVSIPLLLRHRANLRGFVWRLAIAIAIVSVAIQLASVVFWYPLEINQMRSLGYRSSPATTRMAFSGSTFVVGLRFKNIAAVALGKVDQWGLSNQYTRNAGIHSSTPYLLPFLLKKEGIAKVIVDRLIAAWFMALAALIALLFFVQRKARRGDFEAFSPPRPVMEEAPQAPHDAVP